MNSYRWCWTLNNYTDAEVEAIRAWPTTYSVFGREVGENGTPHLQGFSIFTKRQRLSGCKKLQARAHWEPARGTAEQAATYAKKDGNFEETGTLPMTAGDAGKEAEQSRWVAIREHAKRGEFDLIDADVFIRNYRTLKEIRKDFMVKPLDLDAPCGIWYTGAPGVGKSYTARQDYPGAYLKMQNKWWDGYQNEDYVILDDMDCKELGHLLKIWSDCYSFVAETKGGAICIRPKKFVVTSNYSINELFGAEMVLSQAIERRFTTIKMATPIVINNVSCAPEAHHFPPQGLPQSPPGNTPYW